MTIPDRVTRILILEDEALISVMMEDVFAAAGYDVKCAASLAEAKSLLATTVFHAAVLDVGVRDGTTWEVADSMLLRKVPFVFCTGSTLPLAAPYQHVPVVSKPFRDTDLLEAVNRLLKPVAVASRG